MLSDSSRLRSAVWHYSNVRVPGGGGGLRATLLCSSGALSTASIRELAPSRQGSESAHRGWDSSFGQG